MGIQVVCVLHFAPYYRITKSYLPSILSVLRGFGSHYICITQNKQAYYNGVAVVRLYAIVCFLRRGITHKVRVLRHLRECKLCTADFDGELHLTQIFILAEEHVNHQLFAVTESG